MRNLLYVIICLIALLGCKHEKEEYSDKRQGECLYHLSDGRYATFERYMWDEGFPDTLIVPFTRNGKFEMYIETVRQGVLYDSLGNVYSPAYVFTAGVGDTWTYDIHGKFIEYGEFDGHNPNPPYHP